jgi:hypothetical protein
MGEIIKLVSEWGNLAHRVSATADQISGQRFIRLTFYRDDNKAIAALNMSYTGFWVTRDQAARFAVTSTSMTSIPSWNLTPPMTFGN